jgi:hypothetical protein
LAKYNEETPKLHIDVLVHLKMTGTAHLRLYVVWGFLHYILPTNEIVLYASVFLILFHARICLPRFSLWLRTGYYVVPVQVITYKNREGVIRYKQKVYINVLHEKLVQKKYGLIHFGPELWAQNLSCGTE